MKSALLVIISFVTILAVNKIVSQNTNLRLEGYSGLFFQFLFPIHDTEFALNYSDKKFIQIRNGMHEEEVVELLGKPIEKWGSTIGCVFAYSKSKNDTHFKMRQIHFIDKIVSSKHAEYYID